MGLRDTADQLDACRQQSVVDEQRIATLEAALAASETHRKRQAADVDDLARQNAELEHDLARARAETALADRLQHDAHARPTALTVDRDALDALLAENLADEPGWSRVVIRDRILALVRPADGILLVPEEAALAVRAARHSAESIRAVLDVDPTRLHPDVAPYIERLQDLADRLTREGA